jgi:hypothetical protein
MSLTTVGPWAYDAAPHGAPAKLGRNDAYADGSHPGTRPGVPHPGKRPGVVVAALAPVMGAAIASALRTAVTAAKDRFDGCIALTPLGWPSNIPVPAESAGPASDVRGSARK